MIEKHKWKKSITFVLAFLMMLSLFSSLGTARLVLAEDETTPLVLSVPQIENGDLKEYDDLANPDKQVSKTEGIEDEFFFNQITEGENQYIDNSVLKEAVENAETAGVIVAQGETVTHSPNTEVELVEAIAAAEACYTQQISEINAKKIAQEAKNAAYAAALDDYNTALAQYEADLNAYKATITTQQNADGKQQSNKSEHGQALSFDPVEDYSAPVTNLGLTSTNVTDGLILMGLTGDQMWQYRLNPDKLNQYEIEKVWKNAATLTVADAEGNLVERKVNFHAKFHNFVRQPANKANQASLPDSEHWPVLIISSNVESFVSFYNVNWQTQIWFTYADTNEVVEISKFDGSNGTPKFYYLGGSLSSNNADWNNRREYVNTYDATGVVINTPTSPIGYVTGLNQDGLGANIAGAYANINTESWNSPDGEDDDPDKFARTTGVSFTDFTTDKPNFYMGAVPISTTENDGIWWQGNHYMNSDEVAFVAFDKVKPIKPIAPTPEEYKFHYHEINYTAPGKVVANYVDTEGNVLAEPKELTGKIGSDWTTEQKEIPGYVFKEVEDDKDTTGTYTKDDQEVTYVYEKAAPGIALTKTADKTEVKEAGEEITYTFVVKNTGNTVLNNVKVEDPMLAALNIEVTLDKTTLNPGDEATGTATYTVTAEDLAKDKIVNAATATGENPNVDPEDPENPDNPGTPTTPEVEEEVPVTNNGKVVANYVDTEGNVLAEPKELTGKIGSDWTTEQKEIPGYVFKEVEDDKDTTGTYTKDDQEVTYVYEKAAPGIALTKTADKTEVKEAGEEITYTFVVKNTGNTVLNNVKVEDPMLAALNIEVTLDKTTLNPGDEATGTAKYTVTAEDLAKDKIVNAATATSENPNVDPEDPENPDNPGTPTTPEVEEEVPVVTPKPETGKVVTKYVDEEGNPVADPDGQEGEVGTDYTTTPKEVEGYELVEEKLPANANGQFTEEEQEVIYVYRPVTPEPETGKVVTKYVDEEGNPVADPDGQEGEVGSDYTTTPKEVEGYELVEEKLPANANGQFTEEEQEVIYVYRPVTPEPAQGEVIAKYVDKNGNPLVPSVSQIGNVGDEYVTSAKEIEGYTLVEVTGDPEEGTFEEGTKTVVYVYEPDDEPELAQGEVIAKYVDKNGNPLVPSVSQTGNVGDEYVTSAKEIEGYTLVEVTGDPEEGTFEEGTKTVVYVYEPDDEPGPVQGEVIAKYVDKNGNPLVPSVSQTGNIGDEYVTSAKEIEGYTLVEVTGDPEEGTFEEGTKTVVYVYEPDDEPEPVQGEVIAKYVDKNGNPLVPSVSQTGNVGDEYETSAKEIEGYTLVEVTGDPEEGTFEEGTKTVVYVYEKDEEPQPETGKVTTEYVDEEGNPLVDPEDQTGEVGKKYTTTPKEIDGYELVKVPDNAEGEFTKDDIKVTYVYKKVETPKPETGKVTTEYVDEEGNPLVDPEDQTGEVGKKYTTSPKEVDGYELVKVPDNAEGEFTKDDIKVTYVYKKVEAPKPSTGDVTSKYVDENGNPLADPEKQTGEVGKDWSTKPKEIPGYELVRVEGDEAGKYTDDPQEVIYVYKKVEEPKPSTGDVTSKYVDENGNPLADPEKQTGEVGKDWSTKPKEIPGYELVRVEGDEAGKYTDDPQEVIYVYKKIEDPKPEPEKPTEKPNGNKPGGGTSGGGTSGGTGKTPPVTGENSMNSVYATIASLLTAGVLLLIKRRSKEETHEE